MWVLSLLGNKYIIAGILLSVLGIGSIVYINSLKNKVVDLQNKNTNLTILLNISEASVANLRTSIDEQNLAVQKLKDDAILREKNGAEALAKARLETEIGKKRSISIMAAKIPVGKSACDAANDLINAEINNEK